MRSEKDQVLWVRVLSYFASRPGDCSKEISEVLHSTAAHTWTAPTPKLGADVFILPRRGSHVLTAIDQYNLLPPLQVVQILSQNSSVTLSVVKDYISSRMLAEDKQIKEARSLYTPEICSKTSADGCVWRCMLCHAPSTGRTPDQAVRGGN